MGADDAAADPSAMMCSQALKAVADANVSLIGARNGTA